MIPRRFLSLAFGAAVVLAAGSAALVARSLARAIALEPLPRARPEPVKEDSARAVPPARVASEPTMAAVDRDPFRPDRRRPPERFRLPGERASRSDTAAAAFPGGAVVLIGTAVIGDGGFVMCQRGADSPKLVRVGERIGDLTLRSVRRGHALFRTGNGAAVELRVAPPEPPTPAGAGT